MRAVYQKMGEALQSSGRPIVFAACQYGLYDVASWVQFVGANLWRTSMDGGDNWTVVSNNGFDINGSRDTAGPGHWDDPDALQIGKGAMTTEDRGMD
jgi:alpha-galactosidase